MINLPVDCTQLERTPATNSTSKGSEDGDRKSEIGFQSEVDAFESTFQRIQNDYVRSVGSESSKEDYKDRMKVVFASIHSPHFSSDSLAKPNESLIN